jgi:hypothetical protein
LILGFLSFNFCLQHLSHLCKSLKKHKEISRWSFDSTSGVLQIRRGDKNIKIRSMADLDEAIPKAMMAKVRAEKKGKK